MRSGDTGARRSGRRGAVSVRSITRLPESGAAGIVLGSRSLGISSDPRCFGDGAILPSLGLPSKGATTCGVCACSQTKKPPGCRSSSDRPSIPLHHLARARNASGTTAELYSAPTSEAPPARADRPRARDTAPKPTMAETPSAKLDHQAIDMNGVRSQANPPTPHPTPHPASAAGYRRALLKPSTLKKCVPQMVLGERLVPPESPQSSARTDAAEIG